MKIETTFKIFAILSPFIAASLTYFLSVKSKKKDIDIEKEKELNTILSNLLNVWHYLTRLESISEIISNKNQDYIFPKEYLPGIILNTDYINDNCFRELDESNLLLKKYDPIIYYRLEGIGKNIDSIRQQLIMPFFNNPKLSSELITMGTKTLLEDTLKVIEENLEMVAEQISKKTTKKIKGFIDDYVNKETENLLQELDQKYYELMIPLMPENETKPTFEEFKELSKTSEFKEMQQIQMKIALEGTLTEALDIIANNPNVTTEELLLGIEKATHNNI